MQLDEDDPHDLEIQNLKHNELVPTYVFLVCGNKRRDHYNILSIDAPIWTNSSCVVPYQRSEFTTFY